ncbi:YihY/virulence factor BrkB family protein [Acidipila sp. EB88]|uniref:YihY/virulence factor BrkB family protein n=1 Tax=Acidipila sp. EB88 TaxID=2305226 RepID=UPI000F5DC7BC|nr:YihY/virulence factor BrkB family protein [Acidipila sp. EB88]RRA48693.1 YihY/virulence factor BrkB family protein [Acidipila sp. EB88]
MLGVILQDLRRALWKAFGHNAFTIAKAAAYSQLLSLFPALLVAAKLLSATPTSSAVRDDVRALLFDVLPSDTMSLADTYFKPNSQNSHRVVISAGIVAVAASMGVMLSLMEGFRRAYRLPRGQFGFWKERMVALLLIPSTLLPMLFATTFVVFGHQIELWMIEHSDHALRDWVLLAWRFVRWLIALATSVAVLQVIFHFSTAVRPPWLRTIPGALLATTTWFGSTMAYGWYVTRFADYSRVYGSLGAGIATMVWLYFVSIATLVGAEFNAQVYPMWDEQGASTMAEDDVLEYPDSTPAFHHPDTGLAGS